MTAVSITTALEALKKTTDLLEAALADHIFDPNDNPIDVAVSEEARTIQRNRDLLQAPLRLSLLSTIQQEAPLLLLSSFYKTHADVLRWDTLVQDVSLGIRTTLGDFTHLPSGKRYLVVVAPIPDEA